MESTSQETSKAIKSAGITVAIALVISAWYLHPSGGRYSFTHNGNNWVIVGDTRTGRSWLCAPVQVYEEHLKDKAQGYSDLPEDFDGCAVISVPSKAKKSGSKT